MENFDAAQELGANDTKKFKLDPQRILFRLQYEHNGVPPDFVLVLVRDPRPWFGLQPYCLANLIADPLRAAEK